MCVCVYFHAAPRNPIKVNANFTLIIIVGTRPFKPSSDLRGAALRLLRKTLTFEKYEKDRERERETEKVGGKCN